MVVLNEVKAEEVRVKTAELNAIEADGRGQKVRSLILFIFLSIELSRISNSRR